MASAPATGTPVRTSSSRRHTFGAKGEFQQTRAFPSLFSPKSTPAISRTQARKHTGTHKQNTHTCSHGRTQVRRRWGQGRLPRCMRASMSIRVCSLLSKRLLLSRCLSLFPSLSSPLSRALSRAFSPSPPVSTKLSLFFLLFSSPLSSSSLSSALLLPPPLSPSLVAHLSLCSSLSLCLSFYLDDSLSLFPSLSRFLSRSSPFSPDMYVDHQI